MSLMAGHFDNMLNVFGKTVSLEAITRGTTTANTDSYGDPKVTFTTSSIIAYFEMRNIVRREEAEGGYMIRDYRIAYVANSVTVKEGDAIVDGSDRYDVTSVIPQYQGSTKVYQRLLLRRFYDAEIRNA